MKVIIPHALTPAEAKARIEARLRQMESSYGAQASDVDHQWIDNMLHFSFKAKGMKAKGTVEITDRDVIVDGSLPLLAKPFEGKIRHAIEREAESLLA